MNENGMMQDDEISLFDLWEKLRDGWKVVVGAMVLGIAGAVAGMVLIPTTYEALALVHVGQVGQVGLTGGQVVQVAPLPVEAPATAIERLKSPSFQIEVAKKLGDENWLSALIASSSAARSLRMQVLKTAPVIELKTSGKSPEQAKSIADAVIQELARKHAEIAKPMLDKMQADLGIAKEKLASAEREQEGLNKMSAGAGIKDDRFTQLSLIASLRVQKEAEIFGQRQNIMAYEMALMPPATQPAKALEPVYAGSKPVSPKKLLLLALGALSGLLGGVVLVFVSDARRRAQASREGR